MENQSRSSFIMKLTRENVEVHNIDQPMWKIEQFMCEGENGHDIKLQQDNFHPLQDSPAHSNNECNLSNMQNLNEERKIESHKKGMQNQQQISQNYFNDKKCDLSNIQNLENEEKTEVELSTNQDATLTLNPSDNLNDGFVPSKDQNIADKNPEHEYDGRPISPNIKILNTQDEQPGTSGLNKICNAVNIMPESSSGSDSSSESSSSINEPFGSSHSSDPDYHASSSSSESESDKENSSMPTILNDVMDSPKKRGRKRTRNCADWKKNVAKRLRNSGQRYLSIKVTKKNGIKEKQLVERPAKKMLPPCSDKCRLKCKDKISEESRKQIFAEYWNLKDLHRQRGFIASSLSPINPKYSNSNRRRDLNHACYFRFQEKKSRVCKKFFMSTLGITTRTIRTVLEKQKSCKTGGIIGDELRGRHTSHPKVNPQITEGIKNHINSIPRVPSHYTRANTEKEYIEGSKTIADLYRDYQNLCEDKNLNYGSYRTYYDVFQTFNIAFFFPRKDQCDQCVEYANSPEESRKLIQDKYDTHLKEKKLSRLEREKDKETGNHVITYDLQAALPCPAGKASSFYYVSKLNVYNLTFADAITNDVSCYVWHEAAAKRGANEIGSCVWNYLEQLEEKAVKEDQVLDIIFYTDNCAGQNKNRFLFALYAYAVTNLKSINKITHKYLIRGHTQNDVDSVHSVIEQKIARYKKSSAVYVPDQYITLIREAKKKGQPYKVIERSHNDFFDLKDLAQKTGFKDAFKTIDGDVVKTAEIKVFEVRKNDPGCFFFKLSYEQNYFSTVNFTSRRNSTVMSKTAFTKAYKEKLGISDLKKKGILSLIEKNLVPSYYSEFYKNL